MKLPKTYTTRPGAVALALATLGAHGAAGPAPAAESAHHDAITIAAAVPLTGPYAKYGARMRAGAQMAVGDINRAGGISIGGRRRLLKLIIADDGCSGKDAGAVAASLAARAVSFVAGHFCSGASIAAAKIYAASGIIQISPASRHPQLTDQRAGPTIFRLSGRDDQQGIIAGRYLASAFAGRKIAVVHDNTLIALRLAADVRAGLRQSAVSETLFISFRPGQQEYARLLGKLGRSGIEVAYIASYVTETGLIARRLAERGMGLKLMSSEILAAKEFWRIAGKAGDGVLLTLPPNPARRKSAARVAQRLRAQSIEPGNAALYTYGAVEAWRQAAERAGSLHSGAVAAELASGSFNTVIGRFSFDAKGDSSLPSFAIYQWSNGTVKKL